MTARYHIAVLFHSRTLKRQVKKSSIQFLSSVWQEDGHKVTYLFGTRQKVNADLCFVHVDLSVVPDEYLDYAGSFPVSVNGTLKSILKSDISDNLLTESDNYPGKVIVKSDENYAGWPEMIIQRNPFDFAAVKVSRFLNPTTARFTSSLEYRIYDRITQVPRAVFEDPYFVVEKFRPEFQDDLYVVNLYSFLGDSHQFFRETSTAPIAKIDSIVSTDTAEFDQRLVDYRRSLNIDYGKIDYCYDNGELVVFDINKTVGMGQEKYQPLFRQRARALYGYLR